MRSHGTQGRPRDPEVTGRVAQATIEELLAVGYEASSIESIARRAKVGKTSIYRRFESKAELVVAAVAIAFAETNPHTPDTGDPLEDLITLLGNTAKMLTTTQVGGVFRAIVPQLAEDPELAALSRRFSDERRVYIREAMRRCAEAELISEDAIESTIDALLGALYLRFLLLGQPISKRYVRRCVNDLLRS